MMKKSPSATVSGSRYKFVAWIGLFGHPVYWCFWQYYYPQYTDSAFLRFGSAFIFLLLLLKNYWPRKLLPLINSIWHVGLMFALPVIFTFTLLANNYSSLWLATHVGMLLLLQAAVQYATTFFLLLVPGTLIGIAWYQVTINGSALAHFPIEYIPPFLFVTAIGLVFSHLSTKNIVEIEKRSLAEQERQKSAYLKSLAGSIAHEMRNPLAQIHGNLYLIEELQKQIPYLYGAKPIVAEHIKNAQRVIQSGLQVIDITMDAIADRPINTHNFQLLSAKALVEEAVADYAYEKVEHSKRISVEGEDFKMKAEPVMVKYVLYNLIQNALWYIKTLPDAEIVISLKPSQQGPNQIEVRDTGPGIGADAIPKLFDSFYTSGKEGGTGLGLSYCKRTMDALGGDICCESELGQYTAFTLSFPVVPATQQGAIVKPQNQEQQQHDQQQRQPPEITFIKRVPQPPISLVSKTILVAEDDILSRRIVKAMLEKQGINCLEAENGQVALDLLRSQPCDLIITDINMPIIDGLVLIKTVREQQTTACASNQPIPIIAITADSEDRLHTALQIGACDYLNKPITRDKLVPKLQQWLVA